MAGTLTAMVGDTLVHDIFGHSANNGAPIGADATITLTSNAPEVMTVPGTVSGTGSTSITDVPATIVGPGSVDIKLSVSPKDGTGPFEDTFTWLITPLPAPGLVRVELIGRKVVV